MSTPSSKTISPGDIALRHPRAIQTPSDPIFASFATKVFPLIDNAYFGYLSYSTVKEVSIGIALYFEDRFAHTHLMETFVSLYGATYHRRVPLFDTPPGESSPEALLEELKFVLWYILASEERNANNDPDSEGINDLAREILSEWEATCPSLSEDTTLQKFIFSPDIAGNLGALTDILVWIHRDTFIGRWCPYLDGVEMNVMRFNLLDGDPSFPDFTDEEFRHALWCEKALENLSWALPFSAKRLYAEMIRIHTGNRNDADAALIESLRVRPSAMYRIVGVGKAEGLLLEDDGGERLEIALPDPGLGSADFRSRYNILSGCLISIAGGRWEGAGKCSLLKIPESEARKAMLSQRGKRESQTLNSVLAIPDKDRLLFFPSLREYNQWVQRTGNYSQILLDGIPEDLTAVPIIVFRNEDGTPSIHNIAEYIKHPANPYYNKRRAVAHAHDLVFQKNACDAECLMYLIGHDLVPDARCTNWKGKGRGNKMLQENLEFMARCYRRDIDSPEVVRTRDYASK